MRELNRYRPDRTGRRTTTHFKSFLSYECSNVAGGKNISKLSRRALASRRAAYRAKLLANLAGDRAGCPVSCAAGAPSTPSTPTSPQTRSKRYTLRSAEKSIAKTLAEPSSPDGSERAPLATVNPSAPVTLVNDDDHDDDNDDDVDDCSSGGDQRMEFQHRQQDALHPPWPHSSHLL